MTAEYTLWRACERMGIDVRTIGMEPPALVSRLLAWERIRSEEERRRDLAMLRAGAAGMRM